MPIDPEIQPMVDVMLNSGFPKVGQVPAAELRAFFESMPHPPGAEMAKVEDHQVPGPAGAIPVRFYLPKTAPRALMIHMHGGGWTFGTVESSDVMSRAFADRLHCAVLSVDYRLAPENPFPAGVEDCFAALEWAAQNCARLVGRELPLIVGGDSAGGNLSAVMALLARDKGPKIAAQLLINPATDTDIAAPALSAFVSPFLTKEEISWCFDQYLPRSEDRHDWRAAPIRAENFAGLPPAFVLTCEYDLLRAEGEAYGLKLAQAGVATTIKRYPGATHSFLQLNADLSLSRQAFADINAFLDGNVGGSGAAS